ncbi:DNA oxidative demethylase ALKBH2 isoform X2 [Coturnix japonica]|uniref:DNA oxidative demethylase ALKBH2 isoform X2 n=1 Tax=Coturnix japonica TaxID=93934 RepID=UPI0013A5EABE|nr:DNA oxidative demethylase ALKBH2 isoform X2 [Coturnix japonica]
MDRFVVKRPAEDPGGDGKKPRLEDEEEAGGLSRPSVPSQEIRAQGLSLEYRLLFSRAEADAIYQQLEKEVEYFEGEQTKLQVFAVDPSSQPHQRSPCFGDGTCF